MLNQAGPTAKDLHQIALLLFIEIGLIKAVLYLVRWRGWISPSTPKLNGAKHFYLTRAFLPQVCVPSASGSASQTAI